MYLIRLFGGFLRPLEYLPKFNIITSPPMISLLEKSPNREKV